MILCHARALAHTSIYRTSNPDVQYPKLAEVSAEDAVAEDWECAAPPEPTPPAPVEDCGCGPVAMPQIGDAIPTTTEEEANQDE
tara:strand:- start:389 stop:640 length:252 start_codon:yes stop_codon:yes gene_type:complete